jgi:hypothetical protein
VSRARSPKWQSAKSPSPSQTYGARAPVPAAQEPEVLGRDQRDREPDQRLHGRRLRADDPERRQAERQAVRDREAGDERRHLAERAGDQEEGEQEGEVVPAGEDVLDAEPDVPADAVGGRAARPSRVRRLDGPQRIGLHQEPLARLAAPERDAREVDVRADDAGQERAPDRPRDPGRAADRPAEERPAVGPRRRRGRLVRRAHLTAGEQLQARRDVGGDRAVGRQAGQLEHGDAELDPRPVAAELPARVGEAPPVRRGDAGRDADQRDGERELHGSRTRIVARRRRSAR